MKKRLLTFGLGVCAVCLAASAQLADKVVGTYTGDLNVSFGVDFPPTTASVTINKEDEAYIGFELKNFVLPAAGEDAAPQYVGTIRLSDIELVQDGEKITFERTQTISILAGDDPDQAWIGPILGKLSVSLKGQVTGNSITLDPITIPFGGQTVSVRFTGVNDNPNSIKTNVFSAVYYDATADKMVMPVGQSYQVYNIAGQLVKSGRSNSDAVSINDLRNGIYLVKAGNVTTKIVKK